MTATEAVRTSLRELIDERIPEGGTAADTRFADSELNGILATATTMNAAAATCWERKASRAMSERGGLENSKAADATHTFVKLTDYRDHCFKMASYYRGGMVTIPIVRSDFWEV